MNGRMAQVVLDTDFIVGILEYESGDPVDLFRRVFQDLGYAPVVHSYLVRNELLLYEGKVRTLLEEGTLTSISLECLGGVDDEYGRELYRNNFVDMHKQFNYEALPEETDIFASRANGSFGEIHSILLATELGIPLLYSNDGGTKIAARYFAEGRLTVENAMEVAERLMGSTLILPQERKFIHNYYKRRDPRKQHT